MSNFYLQVTANTFSGDVMRTIFGQFGDRKLDHDIEAECKQVFPKANVPDMLYQLRQRLHTSTDPPIIRTGQADIDYLMVPGTIVYLVGLQRDFFVRGIQVSKKRNDGR